MDLSMLYIPKAPDYVTPLRQAVEFGQEQQRIGLSREQIGIARENQAINKSQLGIQQAEEDRKQKTYELMEKRNHTPVYLDDIESPNPSSEYKALTGGSMSLGKEGSNVKSKVRQYATDMGIVKKNPITGREYVEFADHEMIKKMLNEDLDMSKGLAQAKRDDLIDAINKIDLTLQNPENKIKPEDEKKLLIKQSQLKTQLNAADAKLMGYGIDVNNQGQAGTPFGKIDPSKFTPESVLEFQRTGDYSKLAAIPEASAVTINMPKSQEAREVEMEKLHVKRYEKVLESSEIARSKMDTYSIALDLIKNAEQGRFTGAALEVARIGKAFGLEVDPKWNDTQALQMLSNKLAMDARSTSQGAGLAGNTSDRDLAFLKQSVIGITNPQEVNRISSEIEMAKAKREWEISNLATKYYEVHDSWKGWEDIKNKWVDSHSIIDDIPSLKNRGKGETTKQSDVITTKSGRKARKNAQGQYEYTD